jgi:PQQ-dependent catabolism-associated CXXCW motif protein
LFALLLLMAPAAAEVAEPSALWTGPMQSETPATLSGAAVVDAEGVARLKEEGAILLDVGPPTPKPSTMPDNAPWMPVHMSIPGAIWLAGAGAGNISQGFEERFASAVVAVTGGDRNKPIVVFCHPRCWASWNAGKRLVTLGYRNVYWFPGGAEAWRDKYDAAPLEEGRLWSRGP